MNAAVGRAARPSAHLLGLRVDLVSPAEALETCGSLLATGGVRHVVTANPLLLLEAERSVALRDACADADLVVADSAGIAWAAGRTKGTRVDRVAGIDLAFALCETAAESGAPVFLLGGAPGVADAAADQLRLHFPHLRIAGVRHGYFPPEGRAELLRSLQVSDARLFLVALGMPRQEIFIHENRAILPPGLYIGVGGSFDVWAGRVSRAPMWIQRAGLEWGYRWLKEPWRWKRMCRLPLFAAKIVLSRRS